MSAYANDPRVTDPTGSGSLFHVICRPGEAPARVRRFLDGSTWAVWPNDEESTCAWQEFATPDEAIRSLIGDPR